jgi:hypothetical protein
MLEKFATSRRRRGSVLLAGALALTWLALADAGAARAGGQQGQPTCYWIFTGSARAVYCPPPPPPSTGGTSGTSGTKYYRVVYPAVPTPPAITSATSGSAAGSTSTGDCVLLWTGSEWAVHCMPAAGTTIAPPVVYEADPAIYGTPPVPPPTTTGSSCTVVSATELLCTSR